MSEAVKAAEASRFSLAPARALTATPLFVARACAEQEKAAVAVASQVTAARRVPAGVGACAPTGRAVRALDTERPRRSGEAGRGAGPRPGCWSSRGARAAFQGGVRAAGEGSAASGRGGHDGPSWG